MVNKAKTEAKALGPSNHMGTARRKFLVLTYKSAWNG